MGAKSYHTEHFGNLSIAGCNYATNNEGINNPEPVEYTLTPIYDLFNDSSIQSQWETMYTNIAKGILNAANSQCSGQGTVKMASSY